MVICSKCDEKKLMLEESVTKRLTEADTKIWFSCLDRCGRFRAKISSICMPSEEGSTSVIYIHAIFGQFGQYFRINR